MDACNGHRNTCILTAVATAALGLGAAGAAHAQGEAKAFSSLIISDFQLFDHGSDSQLNLGDFDPIDAGDSATVSARLDDDDETNAATRIVPPTPLAIADPFEACFGDCGDIQPNDFTQQKPLFGHFARADAFLEGAIIGDTGELPAAQGSQVSEVQLNDVGVGAADSRIANTTEFEFQLDGERQIRFDFSAAAVLHTILNQDESSAEAGRTFDITIDNQDTGDTVFSWKPNESISGGTEIAAAFNLQEELGGESAGPFSESGGFSATTDMLLGNNPYALTIESTTFANATVEEVVGVSEPGSLGLLGIGLLGAAGALYRRRGLAE